MQTSTNKFLLMVFLLTISLVSYGKTIKVLAIGNSFSEDAVENYLYEIGAADGVDLIIGNMYIGGCSLETHWNNASSNAAAYSYRKIVNGVKTTTGSTTLETAITDEAWDYISFQQVSQNSGMYSTYFPHITNLKNYVTSKATNPNVQYVMHMTWAYEQTSTHSGFANYLNNQTMMYNAIVDAVTRVAANENINIIVPAGTAIQNGRTSFIGDRFCRDGYHLDTNIGRFTAACTWYEQLTGNDVTKNTYAPAGVSDMQATVAKTAAHTAVASPLAVTAIDVELEESKGDFNAWSFLEVGHNGMNAGKLLYTEKNMTLEFWLNIDDVSGNNKTGVNIISNRHTGNQGFSINLRKNNATNDIDLAFVMKNTTPDGSSYDEAFALFLPRSLFSNQWGHLAYVISSDDQKVYAYLNGELYDVIEDIYTKWIGNRVTDELWIGRWYANDPTFYGKMADIRIWTTARTAEEIAENYAQRLKGNEDGLYLYYNFDVFDQTIINVANPGTNNGSLLPTATWNAMHSLEVLAQKPVSLALEDGLFTWVADGELWEVAVVEKITDNILYSDFVDETTFSLDNYKGAGEDYYLQVRTFNNNVYSDWATFNKDNSGVKTPQENGLKIYQNDDKLVIVSDANREVNLFAVDGRLVRTINLTIGENNISKPEKGVYIVDRNKVLVY